MTSFPTIDRNVQIFIDSHFPEYFREEAGNLVTFIKYYYEWLADEGQAVSEIRKLKYQRDTAVADDEFIAFLHDEFMESLPRNIAADERLVMRHILDFYKAKGSERAYRLLFRILYGEEIDFYYPGDDLFRASDGRWTVERRLIIRALVDDPELYPQIIGDSSGATAVIDRREVKTTIRGNEDSLYINGVFGTFLKDELIRENKVDGEIVAIIASDGMEESGGRWIGTEGFLSADKVIQDNWYYQEFSYVLRTSKNLNDWKQTIYKTVHPAGSKLFGCVTEQILLPSIMDLDVDIDIITPTLTWTVPLNLRSSTIHVNVFIPHSIAFDFNSNLDVVIDPWISGGPVLGTGTVKMSSAVIGDFGSTTIAECGGTPIGLFGSRYLLQGVGTTFVTELSADREIVIDDVAHSANTGYIVAAIHSNTFIRIAPQYDYDTLAESDFYFNPPI